MNKVVAPKSAEKSSSPLLSYIALGTLVIGFVLWFAVIMVYPPIGATAMFVLTLAAAIQWYRKREYLDPVVTLAIGMVAGAASYAFGVILAIL